MASDGLSATSLDQTRKAKTYSRKKLILGIISSVVSFALMLAIVSLGYSRELQAWSDSLTSNRYATLFIFALTLGALQGVITLPLGFLSGYVLEHHYKLSNQSVAQWVWERIKASLIGLPLAMVVLGILYFCLEMYGNWWWLPVGIVLTILTVLLARLAPTLLMPLFYRFTPLNDGSVKERIITLCARAGIHINGVFSFNLSKNTKKANAGFTGIGKSRRIVLGDTLLQEFSEEEIEAVFAHELGHYKHRHILVGISFGVFLTFIGLFIASRAYAWSIAAYGFTSPTDLAALPLLAIWLSLFGLATAPIDNSITRRHERQADRYVVETTGNRQAFISALRKLASMNLSDTEPHPMIEFLFHSHPSITRRIRFVESVRTG